MNIKFVINFKAYKEALGEYAVRISRYAEEIGEKYGIVIGVAPQYLDIPIVKLSSRVPIFAQHVDPVEGKYTGSNTIYILKDYEVDGFILNHSEKPVTIDIIKKSIEISKEIDLISLICSPDPFTAKAIAIFNPDIIAVEPPELIGTGISVSKAKPDVIIKTIENVKEINKDIKVFVGAGISNKDDVKRALELGADGILVSSSIIKAKDPYKKIEEFATVF